MCRLLRFHFHSIVRNVHDLVVFFYTIWEEYEALSTVNARCCVHTICIKHSQMVSAASVYSYKNTNNIHLHFMYSIYFSALKCYERKKSDSHEETQRRKQVRSIISRTSFVRSFFTINRKLKVLLTRCHPR